ncbi:hypothetical protein M758_9G030900 [Ceratodon purpureus]|nr:hypothetical protein M758_9G030800 [Ceratodon purpureus]KAG0605094.1 hypothetical protein M758_9G030900 [Ceratodon purpureus]
MSALNLAHLPTSGPKELLHFTTHCRLGVSLERQVISRGCISGRSLVCSAFLEELMYSWNWTCKKSG